MRGGKARAKAPGLAYQTVSSPIAGSHGAPRGRIPAARALCGRRELSAGRDGKISMNWYRKKGTYVRRKGKRKKAKEKRKRKKRVPAAARNLTVDFETQIYKKNFVHATRQGVPFHCERAFRCERRDEEACRASGLAETSRQGGDEQPAKRVRRPAARRPAERMARAARSRCRPRRRQRPAARRGHARRRTPLPCRAARQ